MKTARQVFGSGNERLALSFLESHGYKIETTNARFPVGEIDVIAWHNKVLCFIEVRSTSSDEWGGPLATVTWSKQQRVIRAAQWYLQRLPQQPEEIRFDVLGITLESAQTPCYDLVLGAFEATPGRGNRLNL